MKPVGQKDREYTIDALDLHPSDILNIVTKARQEGIIKMVEVKRCRK